MSRAVGMPAPDSPPRSSRSPSPPLPHAFPTAPWYHRRSPMRHRRSRRRASALSFGLPLLGCLALFGAVQAEPAESAEALALLAELDRLLAEPSTVGREPSADPGQTVYRYRSGGRQVFTNIAE